MTVISEGLLLNSKCVVPENIHYPPPPPPRKGSDFPGGGGSICLIFQWGRGGVTIGKYFQRVLVTRKRVKHEKYIFLIGCISSSLDCFSITKKLHESFPARQTLRDNFLINDIGDAQFYRKLKYANLIERNLIDLVTVFDAILTSRQTHEKLQQCFV